MRKVEATDVLAVGGGVFAVVIYALLIAGTAKRGDDSTARNCARAIAEERDIRKSLQGIEYPSPMEKEELKRAEDTDVAACGEYARRGGDPNTLDVDKILGR